jgi:hypothetical protein
VKEEEGKEGGEEEDEKGEGGEVEEDERKRVEKLKRRRGEGEEVKGDICICVQLIGDGCSEYEPTWLAL